jgi:hypothetical protein
VLRDERSRGCASWPVSDEDTTPFLPSVGITWRAVHFVIMDWTFTGFSFRLYFSNIATVRLFLDIYRFIATVIFNIPFTSHCLYNYFGTSLSKGTPAVSVLVLSKM